MEVGFDKEILVDSAFDGDEDLEVGEEDAKKGCAVKASRLVRIGLAVVSVGFNTEILADGVFDGDGGVEDGGEDELEKGGAVKTS